jgi:2'-5' RNA ligase
LDITYENERCVVRTFIAIPLSNQVLSNLERLQKELHNGIGSGVSWVAIPSIHLTLKFLGEVDEKRIPGLSTEIKNICRGFTEFNLSCGGLGCFPNTRQTRVIWSGIKPEMQLMDLQTAVEFGCSRLGFPKEERRFSPHLTLGRVKFGLDQSAISFLEKKIERETDRYDSKTNVQEVIVFNSELLRTGARYTICSRANLNPASE